MVNDNYSSPVLNLNLPTAISTLRSTAAHKSPLMSIFAMCVTVSVLVTVVVVDVTQEDVAAHILVFV